LGCKQKFKGIEEKFPFANLSKKRIITFSLGKNIYSSWETSKNPHRHYAAGKESHFFLFLKEEILRLTASGRRVKVSL